MTTIHCHIGNYPYRLDYEVTPITTGAIYHGSVYMDHVLDFYCEIANGPGEVLFSPHETPQSIRHAIVNAIVEHEHA